MRAENVLLGPIYDTLGLNNTESDTYQLTQADIDAIGKAIEEEFGICDAYLDHRPGRPHGDSPKRPGYPFRAG